MKFAHRLAYYLLGTMIGVLFVLFIFRNRKVDFCYLPNCRVLQDIRTKGLEVSDEAKQKLTEGWVTMDDIKHITEDGDVDFSRSNIPYKDGKLYVIDGVNAKNEPIEITMVNFDRTALLKEIKKLK